MPFNTTAIFVNTVAGRTFFPPRVASRSETTAKQTGTDSGNLILRANILLTNVKLAGFQIKKATLLNAVAKVTNHELERGGGGVWRVSLEGGRVGNRPTRLVQK